MKNTDDLCPCGSGLLYNKCCESFINGLKKIDSDPELLLRSRFTAYTLKNVDYIYSSWHKKYRPTESKEFFLSSLKNIKFINLVIEEKIISDNTASITYIAFFKKILKVGQIHEKANFVYEDGRWYYTDGIMLK